MIRWLDIGFREWVLPFDSAAARTCVQTAADHRLAGRPISEADCQVAPYAAPGMLC